MASFFGSVTVLTLNIIMVFMASTALSLSSLRVKSETIAAAPAVLPTTPLPPSTEVPPDVAPLLPSSGGVVPSSGYSIPTIPSNPSQDPDEIAAFGPESAMAPSAPIPESSAMSWNVIKSSETVLLRSLLACWPVLVF